MKNEDKQYSAADNWQRYQYGVTRGHRAYTESAKYLEGFYLGGTYDKDGVLQPGGHYNDADLDALRAANRPAYEMNEVKPAVDAALGYQINNRMDISYSPRSGDANKDMAEVRSKVAMQISDNCNLHWSETDVFADGIIQQRGYFDCRMDFEDSVLGEMNVKSLDCMDVIPDPDAKSYDPKFWSDVTVTRFLTLDDIEGLFGYEVREEAEENYQSGGYNEQEFGDDGDGERRNTFGTVDRYDSSYTSAKVLHLRVIDRQHHIRTMMKVMISPEGDIRQLTDDYTEEQINEMKANGWTQSKRRMKRVRWTITTVDTVLQDEWSPYDRFTIVPYFPYFRRGKTRGMVDNAVGPSQVLDKGVSQAIHIVNGTANSGWQMEEDQLINYTSAELKDYGQTPNLVLERKKGSSPLDKIKPNAMPSGIAELIRLANQVIQDVTVPDAMRGNVQADASGVAIQSRQHASQQILAVPLDNLSRTRHMLAGWIDYGISKYYRSERIFKITRVDPLTGKEDFEDLVINQFDPETGTYYNDMAAGEYDLVVGEQPMQVTYDNSEFEQITSMRSEMNVNIPDQFVIKHSNLSDKHDIIAAMETSGQPAPDPEAEAKADLIRAQTRKTDAEAVSKKIESLYSASETAQNIAAFPQLAPISDQIAKSAGFEDSDAPPIIDNGGMEEPLLEDTGPENTNPLTPTNPAVGMNEGLEGGEPIDGTGLEQQIIEE